MYDMIEDTSSQPRVDTHIEKQTPFILKDVVEFVAEATYPLNDQNRQVMRCIDGRYNIESARSAAVAQPGGNVGDIMTILAACYNGNPVANRDARDWLLNVYSEYIGGPENFSMHTDDHAKASCAAGCGHFAQACKDPEAYNLTDVDISWIRTMLIWFKERGAIEDVLHGEHCERGVLVISSDTHGLSSQTKAGTNVFVCHKTLSEKNLQALGRFLSRNRGLVNNQIQKSLQKSAELQLKETIKRLAPDLPVFQVEIDEIGNSQIT